MTATNCLATPSGVNDENLHLSTSSEEICASATSLLGRREQSEEECAAAEPAKIISGRVKSSSGHDLYSASSLHASYRGIDDTAQRFCGNHFVGN